MDYEKFTQKQKRRFAEGTARVTDLRRWDDFENRMQNLYEGLSAELNKNFEFGTLRLVIWRDVVSNASKHAEDVPHFVLFRLYPTKSEGSGESNIPVAVRREVTLLFVRGYYGETAIVTYERLSKIATFGNKYLIYDICDNPDRLTVKKSGKIISFYFSYAAKRWCLEKPTVWQNLRMLLIRLKTRRKILKYGKSTLSVIRSVANLTAEQFD